MRIIPYLLIIIFYSMLSPQSVLAQSHKVRHILVTGFYDWRDLGTPPQQTRCRDNPSCRILATEGIGARTFSGPLAQLIEKWGQKQRSNIQIDFVLLPVTWETLGTLPRNRYQTIIHLGLGVYDSFHRILIEDGAYNWRKGVDAIGISHEGVIKVGAPSVLPVPSQVTLGISRALNTQLPKPFHLVKATARKDNIFLCNSTYYEALDHLNQDKKSSDREAYFIHIPHRETESDIDLSTAVFEVIKALLRSGDY